MERIKKGDLVIDIKDEKRVVWEVKCVYPDGECTIKRIAPDNEGTIFMNNSISIDQLFKVSL